MFDPDSDADAIEKMAQKLYEKAEFREIMQAFDLDEDGFAQNPEKPNIGGFVSKSMRFHFSTIVLFMVKPRGILVVDESSTFRV